MKKYILLLASAALLFSCSEKEDTAVSHDSISVSADTLKFGPDGGTMELKVTSSGDWRLSGLCDWVTPSAVEGKDGATIVFTAEPSNSKTAQETSFKVFTGSAVKKVVVTSTPAYVVSLLSDAEVSLSSDGGSANVKIDTNVPDLEYSYSGDGADWISFYQRSDAFGMTMLQFNVSASKVCKDRESVVTVTGEGRSLSVKFIQAQRDSVSVAEERAVYDLASRDVEIRVKSNIDFDYSFANWMTKISDTTGERGEDGLAERVIKVHLDESAASRFHTFEFSKNGKVYAKYTVKQQNPNPILCNITDKTLRTTLNDLGWIIGDESSTECEVLGPGLEGTELTLTGPSYYGILEVDTIDGLGAFPKLETLNISRCRVSSIDVSDSKSLKALKMERITNMQEVKTGDSPVTEVNFGTYSYDYLAKPFVTISGKNIETIYMNCSSYYISYGYEKLAELDVTGCPALTKLQAKREYSSYGAPKCYLTTIWLTSAQNDAVTAGTLSVEKSTLTEIKVK